MENKNKQYPIPKFTNLEEEDKFWQSHSPILEEYKGKVQRKKQNRASFLSIRLTGEELARLREKATALGLGPSTYARQILIQAMNTNQNVIPVDLIFTLCRYTLAEKTNDKEIDKIFYELNDVYHRYIEMQDEMVKTMLRLCLTNRKAVDELLEPLGEKGMKR